MATLYTRTIGTITDAYVSGGTGTITLKLVCTYTQNTTNNTSTVSIYVRGEASNSIDYRISSWQITGNGATGSGGETTVQSGTRNMPTQSKTLTHGTGGGCTFSSGATVSVLYYYGLGKSKTVSFTLGNVSYALPTINVYSTIAFSSSTPTMGDSVTMTITKANVATSGVRIKATYDSVTSTIYEGTGASTTWTVPDLATTTTDALSKAITITIQSKKGTTYYSAKTYTLTAGVPSTYVPTISIGTVTDDLSAITPFVIGYSKLTIPVTGSVSSDGGATIVSYALVVRETNSSGTLIYSANTTSSGTTQTYTMTTPITSATTYIAVTITDSRGRTATATTTKSASAYSKPSISITAIRCDSGGTASQFGTYAKITVTWSITALTGNAVVGNILTYKSTGGAYSQVNSKAVTGTSGSYNFILSGFQITDAGWFYSAITDKLGSSNSPVVSVAKASMPLSLYDDGSNVGVTVGQIASGKGFNVYTDTLHRNHFVTQSAYPSSSAGFVVVATFTINHTYTVGDVYMKLSTYTETTPFEIGIGWVSSNTTDPAFNRIFSTGKYQNVYLYKKATSTWELIIEVANNRPIAVLDYQCGYDGRSSVTVDFAVSRYATMPGTLGTDIFQAIPWSDLYLVTRQFSAVDLNTFTEAGTFYVYNGTSALHFPSGVNGSLIVIKNTSSVIRQIYFRQGSIGSNDHQIWTRQCQISTNTWGKWQRIQEVVEEGTEGNWTYRKYADGKAECWKTLNTSSCAITTAWTGGFYRSSALGAEDFPTGLFTAVPAVFTGVTNTNGTIIFCTGPQSITATSMGGIANIHVGSGTYNCTNNFLAVGRWY